MSKKTARSTYFTIGRDARTGVFIERMAKNGATTKVMNPRVFEEALSSADRKLKEVSGSFVKSKTDDNR
ncbi:hypothetical protein [Rhizobium cremeum]|uniref:hypothetical protein n=1 Tax=Rhizobium cremeum TaxID=2813827 RepID=UPI0013B03AF6